MSGDKDGQAASAVALDRSDSLEVRLQKVIEEHGEWTDHNMILANGVYTISPEIVSEKLRRILQVVSDVVRRPLNQLRVLDLACLEGAYALEFARQGAQVTAIEGRETNIAKARFACQELGLNNAEFVRDDVRNLSREKYGEFDVVLCLGILYHLDAEDVVRFVQSIGEVCKEVAVFDTYVGVGGKTRFTVDGHEYAGRLIQEHQEETEESVRLKRLWASLDNPQSLWISRPSLINAIQRSGFTSIHETLAPVELAKPSDRITYVCLKGKRVEILSQPKSNDLAEVYMPEDFAPRISHNQRFSSAVTKQVNKVVPAGLRRGVKQTLRKLGLFPEAREPWDWAKPWKKRGGK